MRFVFPRVDHCGTDLSLRECPFHGRGVGTFAARCVDKYATTLQTFEKGAIGQVEGGVFALKGERRVQTDDVGFARQVCKRVRFALRRIATQYAAALGGQDFGNSRPDVSDTYDADGQTPERGAALCRR